MEEELRYVNNKVSKELEVSRDLTLGIFEIILRFAISNFDNKRGWILMLALDGWTSPNYLLIWNFTILTSTNKEYVYQLSDFSKLVQINFSW